MPPPRNRSLAVTQVRLCAAGLAGTRLVAAQGSPEAVVLYIGCRFAEESVTARAGFAPPAPDRATQVDLIAGGPARAQTL